MSEVVFVSEPRRLDAVYGKDEAGQHNEKIDGKGYAVVADILCITAEGERRGDGKILEKIGNAAFQQDKRFGKCARDDAGKMKDRAESEADSTGKGFIGPWNKGSAYGQPKMNQKEK